MASNPYTGDVKLRLPGWPAWTLRFDWAALAQMQAQFGDRALKIVAANDVEALLELTAIGLRCHHPEVTVDELKALPPLLAPLVAQVGSALALAYNGPSTGSGGGGGPANPPNRAARRTLARQSKKTRSPRR